MPRGSTTPQLAAGLLTDTPDADFELQYELPEQKAFVQTDRRRMEQVLDNLIVNAKKNVYPGGVLRLELTVDDGALHFSIFNQGRPIPESDLSKIWTKFYRDSGAAYSGSGLGLSIARSLTELQGGTFELAVDGDLFKAIVTLPQAN